MRATNRSRRPSSRRASSRRLSGLLAAVALAGCLVAGALPARAGEPAPAPHASTPAERQARGEAAARAFMMGHYDDALATYLDLYVQSDGRPEYLRNIGRCQQKLRQYARAIDSFNEYLRRNKKLGADERREVQGFISEMESALAEQEASERATATPPPPVATPARPSAPTTTALPPATAPAAVAPRTSPPEAAPAPATAPAVALPRAANPSSSHPPPDVLTRAPGAPPEAGAGTSALKAGGIVAVVAAGAAAVAATIALLRARSIFDDASKAGCHDGGGPPLFCNGKADSVETSNTVSRLLFVGAGVLGIAGAVMIAIAPSQSPSPSSDGRLSLTVTGRF